MKTKSLIYTLMVLVILGSIAFPVFAQPAASGGGYIQVLRVEGTVAYMTPDQQVQRVTPQTQLLPVYKLRTGVNSFVVLRVRGQQVTIPPETILDLRRLMSHTNLNGYSRVLQMTHMNVRHYQNSSITSQAGVRGSNLADSTDLGTNDVMLDEEDKSAEVLNAIQQANHFLQRNQEDLAFETLVKYEDYRGLYDVSLAAILGNLLFQRNEYARAYPLIQLRLQSPGLGEVEEADLRYKIITALTNMDNLVTALNEIHIWIERSEEVLPELIPNVLNYQAVLSYLLEYQDEFEATVQRMNHEYPDSPLTEAINELVNE